MIFVSIEIRTCGKPRTHVVVADDEDHFMEIVLGKGWRMRRVNVAEYTPRTRQT